MPKAAQASWQARIENILRNTKITEEDFRRKGGASTVHSRILESIEEEWNQTKQPVYEEKGFQIDFVGRTFSRHGKIELAVEVDTWWRPTGNWVKLLDINAPDKVWVYVCKDEEKAKRNLENALGQFRRLAKLRGEKKINNVTILMKVAGQAGSVERHDLFD